MKDMGYAKRNKCHAQESMIKKRKRVGYMKVQVFKSKREKDSSCPKKERKKERER